MSLRATYKKLSDHLLKVSRMRSIAGLLEWDQQVMMPENAADARGEQMALMSGITHDMKTAKELGEYLNVLSSADEKELKTEFNDFERATIRLAKKDYDRETKIPKELAEEVAKLSTEGYFTWATARKENDFSKFQPVLERWIDIKKQMAKLIDPTKLPYDVCIDEFERDMTSARIAEIFSKVKAGLIPLIQAINNAKANANIDNSVLKGTFPIKKQEEISSKICVALGFSMKDGRLDTSLHPFSTGLHRTDVRITTRYREDDFFQGLMGTVHETGHALYEQGLNAEYYGLPVADALSMGIHESQSLLWERHVGLNRPFLERFWPIIQEAFAPENPHLLKFSSEDVYKAVNSIEAGLIRVEADEVTYPMHIILRYELEKGLLDGSIAVKDLPQLWNAKMQEYLGLTPPDDSKGVLQDVHWSGGAIGYFPSYLLGSIAACQFYNAALKQIPDLEKNLREGNFHLLKEWLNRNVHSVGSLLSSDDLMTRVTGEPLNPQHFIDYLRQKYAQIYNLQL
eukprot:GEZU01023617.1.p1 GENE.GEZU01023617.1~~GEZU01023617.1.p1  ORF type:complete len:514 (+),score=160.28 GEZU01023617.1:45-1586(+)